MARGNMIRYLDVCSGYSAFTQANEGLGFECVGYAEIEAFPAALLGEHYGATRAKYMPDPDAHGLSKKDREARIAMRKSMASLPNDQFGERIVNYGDFTQIREDDIDGPVHLLTGGTPCQAFSVAGKRLGLDDPRGNLTLEFLALAKRVRADWLLWENVPGFLSHDDGRTMGTFLRLLGECGYGFAYRVLDAQYIRVDGLPWAVPQRRRRLFLVAHLGDAAGPAAVLFDRESLRGDPAPRRETGQGTAFSAQKGVKRGRHWDGTGVHPSLNQAAKGSGGIAASNQEIFSQRGAGLVGSLAFGGGNTSGPFPEFLGSTASASTENLSPALGATNPTAIASDWAVRRLTPLECERLMGVRDGLTAITYRGKPASDGPRYKALGNSQARNQMRWLARGIADVIAVQS